MNDSVKKRLFRNHRQGVSLLLQAHEYAADLQRNPWDFAVELPVLISSGMTTNDVRWLIYSGLVEHGRDISTDEDSDRRFQHGGQLIVDKRTCLVLTELGVATLNPMFRECMEASPSPRETNGVVSLKPAGSLASTIGPVATPAWDSDRQELRWGALIVKQYKLPSPNQEAILTAFEQQNWPPRIDDPLPHRADIEAKQRLHDTIKNLNRNQKHRRVRFMGDGSGKGVRWETIDG